MVDFPEITVPEVEDETTNRALRILLRQLNSVSDASILAGTKLEAIDLTTSETQVPHKLSRAPVGYLVIGRSANAVVYGRSHDSRFLNLTASAAVTVDLWVF